MILKALWAGVLHHAEGPAPKAYMLPVLHLATAQPFSLPFLPACAAPACVQQSAAAFDGQPGSQLLLVGVQHVHALYAALLALPWCEPGQPDVPLLSAPVPFLHAQLCPLRLVVSCLLVQRQGVVPDTAGVLLGGVWCYDAQHGPEHGVACQAASWGALLCAEVVSSC